MKNEITSGAHLGVVRNWIKWHAWNGSRIDFGSREMLKMKGLSALDLDRLAQDIRDAVIEEEGLRVSELDDLARRLGRKSNPAVHIGFQNHMYQCSIDKELSPEYISLKGVLSWFARTAKRLLKEE
jgi:hypothetical protein